MTFENKDRLSELETTLKQIKAVYNSFENDFISHPKEIALLAVETGFENYQHLSSVVSDLIYKANEQISELDAETDIETA